MKKFLTLILAVLYMASATGATFHMHYCMGKLVQVQLWKSGKQCSSCGTEKKAKACQKKCCKDEHKTVKLDNDHKAVNNVIAGMQLAATAAAPFASLPQAQVVSIAETYPVSNAPPRSNKVQPYILHCTFRI